MADVSGVAEATIEKSTSRDDSTSHSGGDHHGEIVLESDRSTGPTLTESESLGVVVDKGGQSGHLGEAIA
jgi:hypothetical protein